MVAPLDSAWSSTTLSDGNLNSTTYGQGTSFPSTWSTTRLFWRTDENKIYKNTGTEGSPTWTLVTAKADVGSGSVLVDHDGTIGNYTQAIDSISGSSSYPIIQSSFTNVDPRNGDWNLRSVQINGNGQSLNSTWKVVEERNLRDDGGSVYLTEVIYKYSRYSAYPNPQVTWRIELQTSDGTVVDTFNVNGYTGGAWSQGNTQTRSNINAVASKFVVYGKRDGSGQAIIDFQSQYTQYQAYDFTGSFVEPMSNVIDDDTSTFMKTNAETNPHMILDLGSGNDAIISQVALYPHTDLDETEIQIQTSPDNSTYTTRRTITVSNLTTSAWNLIRINSTYCRYIRVRGSSGSSKTLSFNEIKLKSVSTAEVTANHAHILLDGTDTSLGLDGT